MRIGILLTHPKQEQKKGELLEYTTADIEDCPWKQEIPDRFVFSRRSGSKVPLGKRGVPTDVAIGCCIKQTAQDEGVEVDFILPHEVNLARLQSNDLNFLLIYDLLEAFHTDKTERRELYKALKRCLEKADNIFPPLKYQEFVYSKINYYNYMKDNDIAILPTLTMTAADYKKMGHDKAAKMMMDQVHNEEWQRFIAKPVYGQEGKGLDFFKPRDKSYSDDFNEYLKDCMRKYPGVVLQKAIRDFGNTARSPELRLYFMGNDYHYTASAGNNEKINTPVQEGGNLKNIPLERVKREARSILKKLPPILMPNGARLPRLITRLDMGFKVEGKYHPFVNEVEFVPSLYAEACSATVRPARFHTVAKYIRSTASQMLKIAKLYTKSRGVKPPRCIKQKQRSAGKVSRRGRVQK